MFVLVSGNFIWCFSIICWIVAQFSVCLSRVQCIRTWNSIRGNWMRSNWISVWSFFSIISVSQRSDLLLSWLLFKNRTFKTKNYLIKDAQWHRKFHFVIFRIFTLVTSFQSNNNKRRSRAPVDLTTMKHFSPLPPHKERSRILKK